MNEFQSNGDVIKFVVDFAADLSNSHLFKVILDEDAGIDFQKFELLVGIEYLENKCSSISSVLNAISNAPSTLFKAENMIKVFISKQSEVSRWLDE